MTTTMKWLCTGILSMVLFGCATGKCVNSAAPQAATSTGGAAVKPESKLDRVKVYKPDGSLQCGQGKAVALGEMQKDLKGLKVHSSFNKNDGMMRIQVCGAPTGNSNVYEIDRKDLEAAIKAGFKEWTFDN